MTDYVKPNYGRAKAVKLGNVILYFSYNTLIGVRNGTTTTYILDNPTSIPSARHRACILPRDATKVSAEELTRLTWSIVATEANYFTKLYETLAAREKGQG
jgi:hypothetical protein